MRAGAIVLFGAGQLGVMLLARYFFQWVIRFADLGKEDGPGPLLAAGSVGLLFFAFRIFDGVTDPLAGILGDRWVAGGKERRSLIWVSFLIPAVGLALVFSPNHAMPTALRWATLGAGMLLFFVGYTLYCIPYWSLIEDYSGGDHRVRTTLSNVLGMGALLATGIGFIVSPLLVEALGFLSGALTFCLVGTLLMTLPYFAAPPRAPAATQNEALPPMSQALIASLKHPRFLAVILLFAGAQMSLTVMTSAAPYVAEVLLGGSIKHVALLLGPFMASALPAFVFVPRLSRRYGWERATLAGVVVLSVAFLGAGLLGRGIIGTPMQTAMIVFACAGPGSAAILGLEGEAIARCAQAGRFRSTGVYFGVYNFVVKALNGLALYLTGLLAEVGTVGAVRAMPFLAGGLCIAGVGVYLAMKKSDPPALPAVR